MGFDEYILSYSHDYSMTHNIFIVLKITSAAPYLSLTPSP